MDISPKPLSLPDDSNGESKKIAGISGPPPKLFVTQPKSLVPDEIDADIAKMKALWARGFSNAEVRESLGLSKDKWDRRLKRIAVDEDFDDRLLTWKKFEIKKRERYEQARQVAEMGMELDEILVDEQGQTIHVRRPRNINAVIQAIKLMDKIDNDILKHGQELGVFHKEPEKKEVHMKGEHVIAAMVIAGNEETDSLLQNFRALDRIQELPRIRVMDLNQKHPNDTYQNRFRNPEPIIIDGEIRE